ncbi:hypothetical protein BASA81_017129 [Batrachochytrium salamandrivorans]|nr:hypothetical protein BASA81_017129 [Batrachochytrium salamandrivorans]
MFLLSLPWLLPRSMQFGMIDSRLFWGRCASNEPKVPKPTKVTPKCGPIVEKLTNLRRETYDIEAAFRTQLLDYSNLMKGKDGEVGGSNGPG